MKQQVINLLIHNIGFVDIENSGAAFFANERARKSDSKVRSQRRKIWSKTGFSQQRDTLPLEGRIEPLCCLVLHSRVE